MTRDPSDGSVREKTLDRQSVDQAASSTLASESVAGIPTSGLREPGGKADQLARLQRSRDWLSKYRTNPEAVARLKGDTDSIADQRGE